MVMVLPRFPRRGSGGHEACALPCLERCALRETWWKAARRQKSRVPRSRGQSALLARPPQAGHVSTTTRRRTRRHGRRRRRRSMLLARVEESHRHPIRYPQGLASATSSRPLASISRREPGKVPKWLTRARRALAPRAQRLGRAVSATRRDYEAVRVLEKGRVSAMAWAPPLLQERAHARWALVPRLRSCPGWRQTRKSASSVQRGHATDSKEERVQLASLWHVKNGAPGVRCWR